ncbi:hypothetical protein [Egbenema bharatensis]|uniref:hypothetical protein n=1 Tax=Egbenema bharatensis TaxID=3463334 RepID=UPI003A8B4447
MTTTSSKNNSNADSEADSNQNRPQVTTLNPTVGFLASPVDNGHIKFFTCDFDKRQVVVLSRVDWDLLIKLFEAMERLQVAMGKGFMTVQPLQVVHHITHREQALVILPLNAWQRLLRQIEDCSRACDWELFNLHVEQLKHDPTPPPQLPPSDSVPVDIHLDDLSIPDSWEDDHDSISPSIAPS